MRTRRTTTLLGWLEGAGLATGCLALAASLSACGKPPEVTKVACPAKNLASYVAIDLSDSARDSALVAARLKLVRESLTETAVCSGTARVVAFSNSAAATAVLLDGDLKPKGATDTARRKHAPSLVDQAMVAVNNQLSRATASLPGGGTDVVAQLRLIDEFHHQVGIDRKLIARILTDGITTTGVVLNRPDLTDALATNLASSISLPSMTKSTDIVFAGIGKVSGSDIPPTEFTNAIKQFFTAVCGRLGTDSCVPISDLILGVKK